MSSCGKGEIMRNGYTRRAYIKTDGTKIASAKVEATCVPDVGKPGKTKSVDRILPKLDKEMHLGTYGYYLDKSISERRDALRQASKVYGDLKVLRRLNLIRNYSEWHQENYAKLSTDVEYLKTRYAGIKSRTLSRSKSKSKSKSRSRTKK